MFLSEIEEQIKNLRKEFGDVDVHFYKYDDMACECLETNIHFSEIFEENDKFIILV